MDDGLMGIGLGRWGLGVADRRVQIARWRRVDGGSGDEWCW